MTGIEVVEAMMENLTVASSCHQSAFIVENKVGADGKDGKDGDMGEHGKGSDSRLFYSNSCLRVANQMRHRIKLERYNGLCHALSFVSYNPNSKEFEKANVSFAEVQHSYTESSSALVEKRAARDGLIAKTADCKTKVMSARNDIRRFKQDDTGERAMIQLNSDKLLN
ncbi:hypothetical protein G7Z17_g11860 [Cylindrodendrum hubeiense]|uniref:Uncharacterized protein n=1 Tax=Cylindrodendrum hubeiense TaxID=595255 RepID=A0A9P5GZZ9_9HYPO|nr:hypothetical protein G7Z17_g11860 [Cylindrodendrum hubeiense]